MPLSEKAIKRARLFALKWNSQNPIDYAWRKTFNIPFGSESHLQVDFLDQQVWYEEDKLIKEIEENPDVQFDSEGRVIIPVGDGFGMTQAEIDNEFDDMDIDALNKKFGDGR